MTASTSRLRACPESVVRIGATSVEARRDAYRLRMKLLGADPAIEQAIDDMKRFGAKEMEFSEGRALWLEAARAEFLLGRAHESWRRVLGCYGIAEPTDAQINAILGTQVSVQGGGGGGRGGRGR